MCGLVGFLGGEAGTAGDMTSRQGAEALLRRMANSLIHRGPDDQGVWCDSERRIGLGHRRLSIVDLSPAGHQPMVSASGRYVVAFNGEIYNHLELRGKLEDHPLPNPPPVIRRRCWPELRLGGWRLRSRNQLVCLLLRCGIVKHAL